jgi:hypothetical protein
MELRIGCPVTLKIEDGSLIEVTPTGTIGKNSQNRFGMIYEHISSGTRYRIYILDGIFYGELYK